MNIKKYSILLLVVIVLFFSSIFIVHADYRKGETPMNTLKITIYSGTYTYKKGDLFIDFTKENYKASGGGYIKWKAMFLGNKSTVSNEGEFFNKMTIKSLTDDARNKFFENVFTIANAIAADTEMEYRDGEVAPTYDTVSEFYNIMVDEAGYTGSLLTAVTDNIKPNYASAQRWYMPFSSPIGTILGFMSIMIMALLGLSMAMDIAYLTVPGFQIMFSPYGSDGAQKSGVAHLFVSQEAHKAAAASNQANNNEFKNSMSIYLSYRWKGLIVLAICLIYLVQGQIYAFVGWFIDLFSGIQG